MRKINVNVQNEKGTLNRYFSKCIGAGRAGEVMRYAAFEQLKTVQSVCPFEYIRFHGLFHEEMAIVSRNGDGTLTFNFQYVDQLFDSLLSIGIRPVVELGLMPEILAKDTRTVFWWKMNICPPKAIEEWEELVRATVAHVSARYGTEEIKKWYFEVWNEPNHPAFFSENTHKEEYFKLYDAAARAVKSVCPDYRIGGPATAGQEWIPETIAHCEENGIPLDFISSHAYCCHSGAFDADGKAQLCLAPIRGMIDGIRKWGTVCHEKGYPYLLTEWSASYSPRDFVHDSHVSAPFILEAVRQTEGCADAFSYWVYTDIFEETGAPPAPFHGGFGLFNVQGLPKPAFYAFAFLAKLGDTELACTDASTYACKSEDSVQLLFWNFTHPEEPQASNIYFPSLFSAPALEDATLTVEGLVPSASYTVSVKTVGYEKGDVYTAYRKAGFTDTPTREETAMLREAARPQAFAFVCAADQNGTVRITLPQCENQADLVILTKREG